MKTALKIALLPAAIVVAVERPVRLNPDPVGVTWEKGQRRSAVIAECYRLRIAIPDDDVPEAHGRWIS